MNKNDSLGDRMKQYENVSRTYLTRRVPVIIRVDGKAFHTFTRGFEKPFDRLLMSVMQDTLREMCFGIQGCVFGYTQSDEISLVLTDFATINTDAWFGYNIQKMASVAASMATLAFHQALSKRADSSFLRSKLDEDALFDARVFSIPKDEVVNCLIWRQQDATRNSIEAVGHANFKQSELHGKSCNAIQDMLFKEKGINWNEFPTDCRRGAACYRVQEQFDIANPRDPEQIIPVVREYWKIDREIPVFTQDRMFIEKHIEPWRYKTPDFSKHSGNALD